VRPGFSLIDLLVSIVVMGVLIAALMPAVSHVRMMAQRTECRSNIRQQGLALQMYAYDRNAKIPQSAFAKEGDREFGYAPQQTVHLRLDSSLRTSGTRPADWSRWDGLGALYGTDYITSPEVFYCPANSGLNDYPQYNARFKSNEPGAIVGNYQYRLVDGRKYLSDFAPDYTIVANATRTAAEYSHRVGNNMLKSDMSVSWFADIGGRLLATLAANKSGADRDQATPVELAWKMMDTGGTSIVRGGSGGNSQPEDMHSNPNGANGRYENDKP